MEAGLAERSDRITRPLGAVVVSRDGYDVLRQPDQPGYWFGNRLLLHATPEPGSLARWRAVWDRELGPHPGLKRMLLTAETSASGVPAGIEEEAQAQGLDLEVDDVLVLGTLLPHPPPADVQVRAGHRGGVGPRRGPQRRPGRGRQPRLPPLEDG